MKNHRLFLQVIILLFLFGGCAKMGGLTGGYKDEWAPVLVTSNPLNYSVNFTSKKIELEFDEYVALKNVNQELVISPPLPKKPDVRLKNKSVIIDLKNDLRENTTYTLNFGKSIVDNNEANPLTNFEFVFSTGAYLDSLSVKGSIINAFTLTPSKEPFIIGLYDQHEDSVPIKTIPVYIGKTNEKGLFQINNIKADTFKIFALKDANYNLRFDLPNEEIGFVDTVLIITPEFLMSLPVRLPEIDTLQKDTSMLKKELRVQNSSRKNRSKDVKSDATINILSDTLASDSIKPKPVFPSLYVDMVSFLQEGTKLYMTNNERINTESFQLSFSLPLKDVPETDVLDYDEQEGWYLPEINVKRDTFTYWIADPGILNTDSLRIQVSYPMSDSLGAIFTRIDTLKYITRKSTEKSGRGKEEEKPPAVKLVLTSIRNGGVLDYNSSVPFGFNFPIEKTDTSKLHLYVRVDSIEVLQNYEFSRDSLSIRKAYINSNWKEKSKYRIEALPGAFIDYYGHTNDTLQLKFSVQEKAFYGTLTLTLSEVKAPILVQLMNEKEVVLRTQSTEKDGSLTFELLPPAKYKIKFIYDLNKNQKWDTGEYLKKIQPEKLLYYNGEINIRSNWELEIKQSFSE